MNKMKFQLGNFAAVQLLFIFTLFFPSTVYCNLSSSFSFLTTINETIEKSSVNQFDKLLGQNNWSLLNEENNNNQSVVNDWPAPFRVCRYDDYNCCIGESCLQLDPRGEEKIPQLEDKNKRLPFKINTLFISRKKRAVGRRGGSHRKSGGSSVLRGANGRFKSKSGVSRPVRRRPPQRAAAKKALSSFTRPRTSTLGKTSQKPRTRITAQKHTLKPSPGFKLQRKASVGYQLAQKKQEPPKGKENRPSVLSSSGTKSTTPKRHHLSLTSNQASKAGSKQLKPETIQPKKNLKTVVKDGSDDRFPTRKVQVNPNAAGRIEFQKSEISESHLGRGTRVNPSSRARSKSLSGLEDIRHDDTGHLLGASLGGRGVKDNTFPQNRDMNRGKWKSMESVIAKDVKEHGKVTLSQQLVYDDEKSKTRPKEMRFKVEDKAGKLIRYGSVDNP